MLVTNHTEGQISATSKKSSGAKPEDFFQDNPAEFAKRVKRARARVLEAIRFSSRPLIGHEVSLVGKPLKADTVEQLVIYVDRIDGRRAKSVRRQNSQSVLYERRHPRSPQDVKRRRAALFSGKDIPPGYFGRRKMSQSDIDRFVDLMRRLLLKEAIRTMHLQHELESSVASGTSLCRLWTHTG